MKRYILLDAIIPKVNKIAYMSNKLIINKDIHKLIRETIENINIDTNNKINNISNILIHININNTHTNTQAVKRANTDIRKTSTNMKYNVNTTRGIAQQNGIYNDNCIAIY